MKGTKGVHGRTASSLLAVLLLAASCTSSLARPIEDPSDDLLLAAENTTADQKLPQKLQKPNNRDKLWWANPCGVDGGSGLHTPKFTSSEEVDIIEMKMNTATGLTESWVIQLKNAVTHIKKIEEHYRESLPYTDKDLLSLIKSFQDELMIDVAEIQHFEEEDFQFNWLPALPEISKDYKQTKQKPVRAVNQLYKGLQRFAVTIECMMGHSSCNKIIKSLRRKRNKVIKELQEQNPHQKISSARMKMLKEIKLQLKQLLCEVQTFLRGVKNGKKLPSPPIISNWTKPPGDTGQLVQDMGILFKYKEYLVEWEKMTSNLLKSVDPANRKKRRERKIQQEQEGGRQNGQRRSREGRNFQAGRGGGGRRRQRKQGQRPPQTSVA